MEDGRDAIPEGVLEPAPEPPVIPEITTVDRVLHALRGTHSKVINPTTQTSIPYERVGRFGVGMNVIIDKEKFAEIKKRFEETKDSKGRPMSEVCAEYWRRKRGSS